MRVLRLSNSQLRGLIRRSLVLEAPSASNVPGQQQLPLFVSPQSASATSSVTDRITPNNLGTNETSWEFLFPGEGRLKIARLYNKTARGVGKGERILADLFGVKINSNPFAIYDLILDGELWEVKEPSDKQLTFGVIGDSLCVSFLKELGEICDQIEAYLEKAESTQYADFPAIKAGVARGEVGNQAINRLKTIATEIHKETTLAPGQPGPLSVDTFDYDIKFVGQEAIHTGSIKPSLAQSRLLSKVIDDKVFTDKSAELLHDVFNSADGPSKWFDEEMKKLAASNVCQRLAGVFLVSSTGVRCIPTDQLNNFMDFFSITRHKLRFKVKA